MSTATESDVTTAKEQNGVSRAIRRPESRIFLVLAVLVAFFAIVAPSSFPTAPNITNIAADASVLMILSVGSTFVILTAGIDLSINGVLVFSGVIAAKTMVALGGTTPAILIGLLAGLVSGCLWGIVNGFLVAKARIPALIVTLGTLGVSLGSALLITGGVDVRDVPLDLTLNFGAGRVAGIPWLVVVAALVALVGGLVLATTRFGRYTYAVGSNPEALRRAGVSTVRHLISVYAIAGTLSGLAGFVSLARFATTTLGGHSTDNLQTIAAVVIGGTSLFGGLGTMIGTLIGVFIPAVLQNGFVVLGLQPFWQQVAVGAVLVGAVYVDQLRRRSRDK